MGTQRERGDTLIELLVAVVVMGIAVVAITGGVATSIRMSDIHRKQSAAGAYVRDFAEAIENAVSATPTGYVPCAGTTTYTSAYPFSDAAFNPPEVTAVAYWDRVTLTFGSTCTVGADTGVQRLSLRIAAVDTRVVETLVIVIRKPCRSTKDFPLDTTCS
jgi:prepilin-type N-terminal cleavage/methylation domain-containing protein